MPEVVIDLAWPCLPAPARIRQKKDRPVAPTRPNGFVNHVAMVTKKIWIGRADWSPAWLALESSPDSATWESIES